jgi:hypothetical protein
VDTSPYHHFQRFAPRLSFTLYFFCHIFSDIHGTLEGERHVEGSIEATPKIWYRKEHPLPLLPTPSVNPTSIPVWKQVIHLTVNDQDIDICISTNPPEAEGGWVRSDMFVIHFALTLA